MKAFVLPFLVAGLFALAGCGEGVIENGSGKAVGSAGGRCHPDSTCDTGLTCSSTGVCEPSTADSCDGVTCSGHGRCSDTSGNAICECDQGYGLRGLSCVATEGDSGTQHDASSQRDGGGQQDDAGSGGAPVASFTGTPVSGAVPLTVVFTNASTGSPTSYSWAFGDGGTSTAASPSHTYTAAGTYTVALTATSSSGSNTMTRTSYVTVAASSEECYGSECNPTGSPVGGGEGYARIVTSGNKTADSASTLISALSTAESGDVVFVPSTAVIDLTGTYGTVIPGGVTLAGDRGVNGSPGGRIFRYRTTPASAENEYSQIPTFVIGGDDVRVTGLRIEGQDVVQDELFEDVGLEVKAAIKAIGRSGLEVDNCEMWGWSHAAVHLEGSRSAHIHHNSIHHCQARGYGYGVAHSEDSYSLVEANVFDSTRHAIMSTGSPNEGYEARYNIHLGHGEPIGGHHFDVHGQEYDGGTIAGREFYIHHNTFEATALYSLGIRGMPLVGVYVDHNIFESSWSGSVGFQRASNGVYANVFMTDNMVSGVLQATGSLAEE
jgi:PKD repeat protein